MTTSDGQKLGGIRLNMFRPATHTPSHNWHNNPACNKHLFWQKHGFKANLVQHADHIICHRQRCLVEGYTEVEKLQKSLALCQRELN